VLADGPCISPILGGGPDHIASTEQLSALVPADEADASDESFQDKQSKEVIVGPNELL
jgi:hypothetical protein